jgi:hypothetical protein
VSDEVTASRNYYRRIAQELAEAETPQVRAQAVLDRHWQAMREQDEPDEWDYSTGYKERRHKVTCHRGRWDPDF